MFLVDSTDPDHLGGFLEAFAVEQALLVCISATGTDLGPLLQFGIVRDMLKKRVGPGVSPKSSSKSGSLTSNPVTSKDSTLLAVLEGRMALPSFFV